MAIAILFVRMVTIRRVVVLSRDATVEVDGENGWRMSCSSDELRIDNVMRGGDTVDKTFGFNQANEVVSAGGLAQRNIELPMTKQFASEVETHPCQCFTLRLVNGHFVAQTNGELESVGSNTTGSDLNFEAHAQYFDNNNSLL